MCAGARVLFHLKTAYLFVRSDIKTILFPVSGFAFMVSKDISTMRAILVPVWVLAHLFLIDVDNQSLSIDEDKLNKPWRPLPSGRVTISTAQFLSKALNCICLLVSWLLGGRELMIPSVVFCGLVYSYDHLRLNSHYIWKNVINGFGYAVLETEATTVLSDSFNFYSSPNIILALVLSWAVICTTVHVQDLADIEGDQKMGRRTTTIHLGQNVTRVSIGVFLVVWSLVLPRICSANSLAAKLYTLLGISLSVHIFFLRQKTSDERSFRIYNVSSVR
ncbi:UbiA prenyltransferase family [Flammula alnicola]|nr:UbiA prenyltransferase family [Flammula alnicola]